MSTLSNILDRVRELSPEGEVVVQILEVVQAATQLGGPTAQAALQALGAFLVSLQEPAAGSLTPAQILSDLSKLRTGLPAVDAAEDAALAAKFPSA